MNWEEKVEYQIAKIDDKVEELNDVIEVKVQEGREVIESPVYSASTSVVNIAAGGALTYLGKKSLSKENSLLGNVVAASAMVVGSAAVVLSTAKLLVSAADLKSDLEEKKVEARIREEIMNLHDED